MKKIMIFALVLLIFSSFANALGVDLVSPTDEAIFVEPPFIDFICNPSGTNLRFLQLYADFEGTWKKIEEKVGTPNLDSVDYIFRIEQNLTDGAYNWDCKIISDDLPYATFSESNRTITITI